jgi:hypothetical protein
MDAAQPRPGHTLNVRSSFSIGHDLASRRYGEGVKLRVSPCVDGSPLASDSWGYHDLLVAPGSAVGARSPSPAASIPGTWNTDVAMSKPIVVIVPIVALLPARPTMIIAGGVGALHDIKSGRLIYGARMRFRTSLLKPSFRGERTIGLRPRAHRASSGPIA